MKTQTYDFIGLIFMGIAFCGCSEKVQTEEKKAVIEEQAVEPTEVNSLEEIMANKLRLMIMPRIDFEDVSFEEALDFLRLRAVEVEYPDYDPAKRGINMVIRRPRNVSDSKMSDESADSLLGGGNPIAIIPELRVRNVSFAAALRYICLMTNMRCEVDECLSFAQKDPKAAWDSFGSVLEEKGDVSVISEKLRTIILPRVDFEGVSIHEAIDFIRQRSVELDRTELDPSKKGMNFVIYVPKGMELPRIDELRMRDASFEEVLKQICAKTGMRYELDQYSVILVPKDLK